MLQIRAALSASQVFEYHSHPREGLYKVSVQTSFIAPKHTAVTESGLVYLLSRQNCNTGRSNKAAPAHVF